MLLLLKKLDLPKKAAPDLKNWTFLRRKKPKTLHNYWFDWEICRKCRIVTNRFWRPLFMQELQMRLK
jgi:hypothetical protein